MASLLAFEAGIAVAEAALGGREGADGSLRPVPGADPLDEGRHLGPVGTDVLDRNGPHGPGYPGEGFHPGPLGSHGPGDEIVPDLPRGDLQLGPGAVRGLGADPPGGDLDHGAVEALVGDQDVGAAAEDQDRFTPGVTVGDGVDELLFGRRLDEAPRGPAEPEGGVVRERLSQCAPPPSLPPAPRHRRRSRSG